MSFPKIPHTFYVFSGALVADMSVTQDGDAHRSRLSRLHHQVTQMCDKNMVRVRISNGKCTQYRVREYSVLGQSESETVNKEHD